MLCGSAGGELHYSLLVEQLLELGFLRFESFLRRENTTEPPRSLRGASPVVYSGIGDRDGEEKSFDLRSSRISFAKNFLSFNLFEGFLY